MQQRCAEIWFEYIHTYAICDTHRMIFGHLIIKFFDECFCTCKFYSFYILLNGRAEGLGNQCRQNQYEKQFSHISPSFNYYEVVV